MSNIFDYFFFFCKLILFVLLFYNGINSVKYCFRFPFTQAAAVHRPKALSKRRKTKKTFRSKWAKKHKRKHAELVSLAEKDRRLTVQHLKPLRPQEPQEPQESHSGLECCPTVIEMVQPSGGVNMEGHIVELFRHGDIDQRIYEHSCRPDVLEKPCRFVEKVLRPISRCVQQFSYTYAVVGDHPGGLNDWRLDYIRIRSGCSCEILP